MVTLSIVIPTYNEGKYLGKLLKSIKKQDFHDYEILVSDSKSRDNTVSLAKKFGAKVISGPRKGPGYARNIGGKKAKGRVLLFLDADVILPHKNIFSKVIYAVSREHFVGGTSTFKAAEGTKTARFFFRLASKILSSLYALKKPIGAPGFFIFVRKDIFNRVHGFDTELPYCEDHDFSMKMRKFGKLKLLKEKILVSSRRFKTGGIKNIIKEFYFTTRFFIQGKDYFEKRKIKFKPANELKRGKH
jgi:glycosyltransferase involved in cell wall biosynthesis